MSLTSNSDTGKNLTGDFVAANNLDSYTPSAEVASATILIKLTSLNAAAATFTVRLTDENDYVLAEFSVPKSSSSDTGAYLLIRGVPLLASEAYTVAVKSSNSSDTAVDWAVTWFDAAQSVDWLDGGRLDLLIDAIKAVTDALADVDSTGGEAVSAAKALEAILAVVGGNASYSPETGLGEFKGRDGSTTVLRLTVEGQGLRSGSVVAE